MLQALTYVATGASVLLGTLHMDLYIAVTTATVSLLTGILEYQKLEATVINPKYAPGPPQPRTCQGSGF